MNGTQRVALIAVSDRDLALQASQGLGKLGYKVVVTTGSEAAATGLRDQGLDAHFHRLDLTDSQAISALVEALGSNSGRIDVLVADAMESPENQPGHTMLCRAVLPFMQAQRYGRIALLGGPAPALDKSPSPKERGIKINAVGPVEARAEIVLWLATLPDDGPSGGVFHSQPFVTP